MDHREQNEQQQVPQERPMRRAEQQSGGAESVGQTMRVMEMIEHKLSDAYRIPMKRSKVVVDISEMTDRSVSCALCCPRRSRRRRAFW